MRFGRFLYPMAAADANTYRRLYRVVRKYHSVSYARRNVFGIVMRNHLGREVVDMLQEGAK